MDASKTIKALRDVAVITAAAIGAATAWASGLHEDGYILEAPAWYSEVARVPSPDWPVDNWYRLLPSKKSIEVRRAVTSEADGRDPADAIYVRVPGTRLVEGERRKVRFAADSLRPKVGMQYEMALGKTRFSFTVTSERDGTFWEIAYAGQTHTYRLGLPAAANCIHAIADFDGDGMPDFLVEVGDETYLLLSSQAQPGGNEPSAQLWALQVRP